MSSPTIEKVRAELKPGTIYYRNTGKPSFIRLKGNREEEDDFVEVDEEEEDLLDEEEKKELKKKKKAEEERRRQEREEEDEMDIQEDEVSSSEEEEEEIPEEPEEKRKLKEPKSVTFETIEDLVNEKVEYPTRIKEFNKLYGLSTYTVKLVPKQVTQKIAKYEVTYPAREMVRVDESGKHIVVEPTLNKISMIDPIRMRRVQQTEIGYSVRNTFDERYQIGTYVAFSSLSGPIVAFDGKGVTVSVAKDEVKFYDVPYTDPSLKVIAPPKKKLEETKRLQEDIRLVKIVPQDLRDIMVSSYVTALTGIMGVEEKKEIKDKDVIEGAILQTPQLSFDDYYQNQFNAWLKLKLEKEALRTLNGEEIIEEARNMARIANDTKILIQDAIGELKMDENTTIYLLQNQMSEIKDLSPIQAQVLRFINQEVLQGHGSWKGKTLIGALSAFIQDLKHFHRVTVDDCYKILREAHIDMFISNYEPTEEDHKVFEEEHLAELKILYQRYLDERKRVSSKSKPLVAPSILPLKEEVSISDRVKKMEERVFKASGSVMMYMQTMTRPYIFLIGPLSKYAKYLHAKLKNGSFSIDQLADANLAILLPEIPMNTSLSDKDLKLVISTIAFLQGYEIDKFLGMYTSIQNPTHPLEHLRTHPDIESVIRPIVKFMVDLKSCPGNTRKMVRDGRYVYVPGTNKYQMETIPEGDLVIYYDRDTKQFSCHDSNEVVRAISSKKYVNPVTGREFSKEFISKMKKRYVEPEPKEPLPEEKVEVKEKIPVKAKPVSVHEKLPTIKMTKSTGRYIEKVVLKGDPFELFLLFNTTAVITDSSDKERSIKVEEEGEESENVAVVVGVDYDSVESIVGKIKRRSYLVVQSNIDLTTQAKLTRKIKASNSNVVEVYYIPDRESELDIRKVVQKVVGSEEGKIAGQK